jgi:hypothetical protein
MPDYATRLGASKAASTLLVLFILVIDRDYLKIQFPL